MKQTFLFFIALLIINYSFAQNQQADMIFKDGDTISGYAMVTRNDKIKFRASLDDKLDKWDYKLIKGIIFYGFQTTTEFEYVKINRNQKPVLLEIIYYGKVNLYHLHHTCFLNPNRSELGGTVQYSGTSLYVKREAESIATNLAGRFKKKSLEYFKDCPEIVEIFSTRRYLKYSIEDVVVEYNTFCPD